MVAKLGSYFHLSYPRSGDSVNSQMPPEICKVKYCDFDDAVRRCLEEGVSCSIAKLDMSSAFRHLGIKKEHWKFLVMKAQSPFDGKFYFFVDKCLPFGSSISCAHFQAFSDAVAHTVTPHTKKETINYLDDFLFAVLLQMICNQQVETFLRICADINFPVSMEKTCWSSTRMVFLGLLLHTVRQIVCVPEDKIARAKTIIAEVLQKKKVTLHKLQKLCGYLNFLCRAVLPGRAFTRRLYAHTSGKLKPHHHIKITGEMRSDLNLWIEFLNHPTVYCRKFIEFHGHYASELDFYTDASGNFDLGMGAVCQTSWMFVQWDQTVKELEPSIEYLELFALTTALLTWLNRFQNRRIYVFCDNMSVVHMINSMSSSCKNCMILIRKIVLESMCHNVRVYAKHVRTDLNCAADALSRKNFKKFWQVTKHKNMEGQSTPIPACMWPMSKVWFS